MLQCLAAICIPNVVASVICELCHRQHVFRYIGVYKVTGRGDAIGAFSGGIYHAVRPRVGFAAHYDCVEALFFFFARGG